MKDKMRVCLINPPRIHPKGWGKPTVYQPWAIAYVAAVLEQKHKVQIIDMPTEGWRNLEQIAGNRYRVGLTNKQLADRIRQWSPDVVGISIPFSGWSKTAFEVVETVKDVDNSIVTFLDGLHPTARSEECLSDPNVDYVVRGEGEKTIPELVDTLEKGNPQDFEKVKGIGFVKNKKTVITPPRPEILEIDSIPFPARHLLPMQTYFEAVKENPIRGVINKPWAIMITSRGCPHDCIFCSNHVVMGRKWRPRSPEKVVEELEQLVKAYKIKQLDFYDDNMTLKKDRVIKMCNLIKERGIDVEWYVPTGVRADTLDEELLVNMKQVGCRGLRIAPESGVQRVVNNVLKKKQDLKKVENAVVLANKVGIKLGVFFILGVIGETKQDMKETINFAYKLRKLGAKNFHFSVAMPLYGTELYEQAVKGGFLKDGFNDDSLGAAEPLIQTLEFTPDDVREMCMEASLVNQAITRDKVMKAIRHPKDALKMLMGKKE